MRGGLSLEPLLAPSPLSSYGRGVQVYGATAKDYDPSPIRAEGGRCQEGLQGETTPHPWVGGEHGSQAAGDGAGRVRTGDRGGVAGAVDGGCDGGAVYPLSRAGALE